MFHNFVYQAQEDVAGVILRKRRFVNETANLFFVENDQIPVKNGRELAPKLPVLPVFYGENFMQCMVTSNKGAHRLQALRPEYSGISSQF